MQKISVLILLLLTNTCFIIRMLLCLIISMTKLLDADWSRGVQLFH